MNQSSKNKSINQGAGGQGDAEAITITAALQQITEEKEARKASEQRARGAFACVLSHPVAVYGGDTPLTVYARGAGATLAKLAESAGKGFAKNWEMGSVLASKREKDAEGKPVLNWRGGRTLETSDIEEISAIHYAAFAGAFAGVGVVPSSWEALHARRGNMFDFRVLRVWIRAGNKARKAARSYLYAGGAEKVKIESLDSKPASPADLQALAALWNHGAGDDAEAGKITEGEEADWLIKGGCGMDTPWNRQGIILNPERLRRFRSLALWCLRAYWMGGASRKWKAGFESDYALLRAASLVASGAGLEVLHGAGLGHLVNYEWRESKRGKGSKGGANGRLLDRLYDLRLHIASGDLMLTDEPERVAGLLIVHLGAKIGGRAARSLVSRHFGAARSGDGVSICDEVRATEAEARAEAAPRVDLVSIPSGAEISVFRPCVASVHQEWIAIDGTRRGAVTTCAARLGLPAWLEHPAIDSQAARVRLANVALAEAFAFEDSQVQAARREISAKLARAEDQLDAMQARRLAFDASIKREDYWRFVALESLGLSDDKAARLAPVYLQAALAKKERARLFALYTSKADAEAVARRAMVAVRNVTEREKSRALNGHAKAEAATGAELAEAARRVASALCYQE